MDGGRGANDTGVSLTALYFIPMGREKEGGGGGWREGDGGRVRVVNVDGAGKEGGVGEGTLIDPLDDRLVIFNSRYVCYCCYTSHCSPSPPCPNVLRLSLSLSVSVSNGFTTGKYSTSFSLSRPVEGGEGGTCCTSLSTGHRSYSIYILFSYLLVGCIVIWNRSRKGLAGA
jgi:hypothetical protein